MRSQFPSTSLTVTFAAMLSICCIVIPVNGQPGGEHSNGNQKPHDNTKKPEPQTTEMGMVSISTVKIGTADITKLNIKGQPYTNGKAEKRDNEAKSYLSRSVQPETLPNWILCVVGIGGILVAIYTLRDIKTNTILNQRPRVSVRVFYFSEMRGVGGIDATNGVAEHSLCIGQFYIQNEGGTDAHVREWSCEVLVTESLPMKPPYEGIEGMKTKGSLRPGQSSPRPFARTGPLSREDVESIKETKSKSLYVLGNVHYTDGLGILRITRFCRRYDVVKDRFVAVGDPDYEYEG